MQVPDILFWGGVALVGGAFALIAVYIIIALFRDTRVQDATQSTMQTMVSTMMNSVSSAINASIQAGHAERMELLRTVGTMMGLSNLAAISTITGEQLEDLAKVAKDLGPFQPIVVRPAPPTQGQGSTTSS